MVVVTWQGADLLRPCLESLRLQSLTHDVLVVDNASTDGTTDLLARAFPEAEVLRLGRNTGFAGGLAAALATVRTRYVAVLNNDATADPQWLRACCTYLDERADVAAVTSRMLLADRPDTVNNAGVVLLSTGYGADRGLGEPNGDHFDVAVEVFGASGGASVFRTLAVKAVGGVEPGFFMYYEDSDLSWRLRLAGWRVEYCPEAVVHHQHAASSDVRSSSFAFYNERNRLVTLMRCAPPWFAARAVARHALTTGSLAAKRLAGRPAPAQPVFNPALRIRALGSAIRRTPESVRARALSTSAQRRRILREWAGTTDRPIERAAG